jgi:hypothetical protein
MPNITASEEEKIDPRKQTRIFFKSKANPSSLISSGCASSRISPSSISSSTGLAASSSFQSRPWRWLWRWRCFRRLEDSSRVPSGERRCFPPEMVGDEESSLAMTRVSRNLGLGFREDAITGKVGRGESWADGAAHLTRLFVSVFFFFFEEIIRVCHTNVRTQKIYSA